MRFARTYPHTRAHTRARTHCVCVFSVMAEVSKRFFLQHLIMLNHIWKMDAIHMNELHRNNMEIKRKNVDKGSSVITISWKLLQWR